MAASNLRWTLAGDKPAELFEGCRRVAGKGQYRGLTFLEVEAKSIINRVPYTNFFPFEYTINCYRGCSHACVYCFARTSHDYLGLGIGEDFDRRIVVKVNAAELTRALRRSSATAVAGDELSRLAARLGDHAEATRTRADRVRGTGRHRSRRRPRS